MRTREEIEKSFEEDGIHGRTPEETQQVIDAFMSMLKHASGVLRAAGVKPMEPRERSEETMRAMKEEIQAVLEAKNVEETVSPRTIDLLKRALRQEDAYDFFNYIDLVRHGRDQALLEQKYSLNLRLTD